MSGSVKAITLRVLQVAIAGCAMMIYATAFVYRHDNYFRSYGLHFCTSGRQVGSPRCYRLICVAGTGGVLLKGDGHLT